MDAKPARGAGREVMTGTLLGLQRVPPGLWGVAVALDRGGVLLVGPESLPRDLFWTEAHKGCHLSLAITRVPGDDDPVIDLALLEGALSREARDAGLVERTLGFVLCKVGKDQYRILAPEGHSLLVEHGEGPHYIATANILEVAADIRRQMTR